MIDVPSLTVGQGILSLSTGFILGLLYFGGLWWTSQRVAQVRMPGLFFLGSFAVRLGGLIGGIFLVTGGRLVETGICLLGVLAARRLLTVKLGKGGVKDGYQT